MNPDPKPFRFKQFNVHQSQTAMKVGTDGVLLGAWTPVQNARKILDIGCGTGLLSLMLAQRSNAMITAIELDPLAAEEADYNVSISPWKDQIKVIRSDFLNYTTNTAFDLIICNPPFYRGKNHSDPRSVARQLDNLPFDRLFSRATRLLAPKGSFSLIIPFAEKQHIFELAEQHQLFPQCICQVKGHAKAEVKRLLIHFSFSPPQEKVEIEEIIIEKKRNQFTEQYQNLLQPYLLHL